MSRTALLWIIWIVASLLGGGALASIMYIGGPRDLLLIGQTTSAHHQIELACESCHTTSLENNFFKKRKVQDKAMTKACLDCHKKELEVSNDSHPVKKFRGPQNFARREKLDGLYCHTCHAEHVPEITRVGEVTLPTDFCTACHQEIAKERPSHVDLGYETCATAGCHNYHDNTALYEKFLVNNAGKPDFAEKAVMAFAAHARQQKPLKMALATENPLEALSDYLLEKDEEKDEKTAGEEAIAALEKVLHADDAIAPAAYLTDDSVQKWAASAHALSGLNCAACHAPEQADSQDLTALETNWIENPGVDVCADCHKPQANTFREGKHGITLHKKLPKLRKKPKNEWLAIAYQVFQDQPVPTFTVGQSRLPMKEEAHHLELANCGACHKPHEVDLKVAAVESCVGCHDDNHTRAYFDSPHYQLWQAELSGAAAPGTGVACADCHMPKDEGRRGAIVTNHNQNAFLRPNEKMIRPVCSNCHGLEFTIDALADPKLVESNFNGLPSKHIESVDWATARPD